MTSSYVLEIMPEAFPTLDMTKWKTELSQQIEKYLRDAHISYEDLRVYASSRRLSILVLGLPRMSQDSVGEILHAPILGACLAMGIVPIRVFSQLDQTPCPPMVEGAQAVTTAGPMANSNEPISIPSVDDYLETLKKEKVLLCEEDRRTEIQRSVIRLSRGIGGSVMPNALLMQDIVERFETPRVYSIPLMAVHLDIPENLLLSVFREDFRAFAIVDDKGNLLPYLLRVTQGEPEGWEDTYREYMDTKLLDISRMYHFDLQQSEEQSLLKLKDIPFREGLGSYYDKTFRLKKLTTLVAEQLVVGKQTTDNATRAAGLAKLDLTMEVYRHYPELRGGMGGRYAKFLGENNIVSAAITDQYLPCQSSRELPKNTSGKILGIADRIDNIAAAIALGPGPQEEYELSQTARGLIRIIVESKLDLDMEQLVRNDLYLYVQEHSLVLDYEKCKDGILRFILREFHDYMLEQGYEAPVVDAVLATGILNLYELTERIAAVTIWKQEVNQKSLEQLAMLFKVYPQDVEEEPQPRFLLCESEKVLYDHLSDLTEIEAMLDREDIGIALNAISQLREPMERFFAECLDDSDDPEIINNRRAIITKIKHVIQRIFIPGVLAQSLEDDREEDDRHAPVEY